jgi:hypothetical protein
MSALVALVFAQQITLTGPLSGADGGTKHERSSEVLDLRMPVRYGFAYGGITSSAEMSVSLGIAVDVARITPNLSVSLVLDLDGNARPDVGADDRRSSFTGFGEGAGLFYLTDDDIGLDFEVTTSLTFDERDLVGGGFAFRASVYPFYMRIDDATKGYVDHLTAWVRGSLSLWAMARVDLTSDGNGATLAFGASIDLARFLFLPYIKLLQEKIR